MQGLIITSPFIQEVYVCGVSAKDVQSGQDKWPRNHIDPIATKPDLY